MIITRSEDNTVHHTSLNDPVLSNNYAGGCKVLLPKPHLEKKRALSALNLLLRIMNLNIFDNDITSLNNLVEIYTVKIASLLDNHAPVRNKVITLHPTFFGLPLRSRNRTRVKRRRLERRWWKTRLTVDREICMQQCVVVHRLICACKASLLHSRF